MKIFIVGKHASGKLDVLNILDSMGIHVGREFCNIPSVSKNMYIDPQYEKYDTDDIEKIFENKSYLYLGGVEENNIPNSYTYYRGISMYTYDNSDVMILSPAQLTSLNKQIINDDILFVWLDNNRGSRIHKHVEDHRTYNFIEIEKIESRYDIEFTKILYNFPRSSVIYFTNEDPCRVATIIAAIIKHPDLLPIFVNNFN